jgi:prepilin-type processing-associated H-X9-DG protein
LYIGRAAAFTLVELLVVVGIIAVVIALLLPALAGARRQVQQVACLSNLRQVTVAFLSYAQDNRGWFPAPADGLSPHDEDWVHWQPGRDVRESQLFRYLGVNVSVLKCPGGVPERGPSKVGPLTVPPYPFSYSVNVRFTGFQPSSHWGPPWGYGADPVTLNQVIGPSRKLLVIEEDSVAINDGAWWAGVSDSVGGSDLRQTARHDRYGEAYDGGLLAVSRRGLNYFSSVRGNVGFADGHCEFFPRTENGPCFNPLLR